MRENLKYVALKNGFVFNGEKIYVQSMLNVSSKDIEKNITQAKKLQECGCDIIRVAVPFVEDTELIRILKKNVSCPIVADVHFSYKIAIESVKAGADKIRINPSNITKEEELKEVVDICKKFNVPIRIGVNSGSLDKEILKKYRNVNSDALVESAIKTVDLFENKFNFTDIVVSIKSSNVLEMIDAYKKFRNLRNNPLHLGVTEAGLKEFAIVKSSIGIGSLLAQGIGETFRVSITGDPIYEVEAAKLILKALGLNKTGVEIIACPTCGRTKIDILSLAEKVEKSLRGCKKNIKVAIMGCVVNGPGEAKEADIGIAGGDKSAVLFKKGQVVRTLKEEEILNVLLKEIELI